MQHLTLWSSVPQRVRFLSILSVVVGAISCAVVIAAAYTQGLDPARLTGDSRGYVLLAENIYQHAAFSFSKEPPFIPDSFRAPGYPAFLAGLYALLQNWLAVLVAQALLTSIAPVLLYLLLRPYHERAAWIGSLLYVFEPVRLFASSTLLSDALFVCLFLASALCVVRAGAYRSFMWAAAAGLLIGISILVRPIAQFLPLLLLLYLWLAQVPLRRLAALAAVSLLACAVVVLPWMARNHNLFGSWSVSSVSSYNLAAYNAPAYAAYRPSPEATQILESFEARQHSLVGEERITLARADEFSAAFWSVIKGREFDYAFFHLFKTLPFFLTDGLRDTVRLFNVDLGPIPNFTSLMLAGDVRGVASALRVGGLSTALFVLGSGLWVAALMLCCYALYRLVRGKQYAAAFMCCAVVLYFALLTGPVSNARYRLPVEGFLLVGAAAGAVDMAARWRGRKRA